MAQNLSKAKVSIMEFIGFVSIILALGVLWHFLEKYNRYLHEKYHYTLFDKLHFVLTGISIGLVFFGVQWLADIKRHSPIVSYGVYIPFVLSVLGFFYIAYRNFKTSSWLVSFGVSLLQIFLYSCFILLFLGYFIIVTWLPYID